MSYNPFELSDALIRDLPHARVIRCAAHGNARCRYEKTFKPDGLPGALYWTQRENEFLLEAQIKRLSHTVQLAQLETADNGFLQTAVLTKIATFDAGVTVEDWASLRPRYVDGTEQAHPFLHVGMFLHLARACLVALEEIHRHGIVHCDIKADNICLPYDPYPYRATGPLRIVFEGVRLIDFAFAITPERPLLQPLPILPTADYQAPRFREALRLDAANGAAAHVQALDWRMDLYSLGVMLAKLWARANPVLPRGRREAVAAAGQAVDLLDWLHGWGKADLPGDGGLPHRRVIAEIDAALAGLWLQDVAAFERFSVAGWGAVPAPIPITETPLVAAKPGTQKKPPIEAKSPSRAQPENSVPSVIRIAIPPASPGFLKSLLKRPTETKDVFIEMAAIPAGEFWMGSADDDPLALSNEKPRHRVKLRAFRLGKTPVTQAQWRMVMGADPPELKFKGCDDCPVEGVGFDDVQEFIQILNQRTGQRFRLPSEAEWEYACRAGTNFKYSGSDNPDEVAWYGINSGAKTHPVALKKPNTWGLYDMSGNVWEWVEDVWHDNYQSAPSDGGAWTTGGGRGRRAVRGGGWSGKPVDVRSANRSGGGPSDRNSLLGFRLAQD